MSWPTQLAETWKDVVELAVLIVAVIIALVQLELVRRQMKDQQQQAAEENIAERRRRTLELDSKIADLAKPRKLVEKSFPIQSWSKSSIPLQEVESVFAKVPDLELSLEQMLQQFEILSLPVCARVADEDMAFELIGAALVWYGRAFDNYIKDKRIKDHRPDLYIYLSALAESWEKRLQKERGQEPLFLKQYKKDAPSRLEAP